MNERLLRTIAAAGVATVCLAGLAGCGGGSGGETVSLQDQEDRTASSWPGMLVFAQNQIATKTSETAEPRPISGITPPLSETDEPAPL